MWNWCDDDVLNDDAGIPSSHKIIKGSAPARTQDNQGWGRHGSRSQEGRILSWSGNMAGSCWQEVKSSSILPNLYRHPVVTLCARLVSSFNHRDIAKMPTSIHCRSHGRTWMIHSYLTQLQTLPSMYLALVHCGPIPTRSAKSAPGRDGALGGCKLPPDGMPPCDRSKCYVSDWTDGINAHVHIFAPSTYIFFASGWLPASVTTQAHRSPRDRQGHHKHTVALHAAKNYGVMLASRLTCI